MKFLIYFLTSLIVFLGIFIGVVLALAAKEELKAGRKYFILMEDIILLLIISVLFVFYAHIYLVYYIAVLLIFLLYFNYKKFNCVNIKKPYLAYSILAIIFFLSSKKPELFVIEASLIFIYGLPAGSLLTITKDKRETIKRILPNLIFVIVALL